MNDGFVGNQDSIKDREDYIKKRIIEFFNEKYFDFPAIKTTETFDKDYSDKENWEDIKSDVSAVGFSYLKVKKMVEKLLFSKKKGKVVLYFNCC